MRFRIALVAGGALVCGLTAVDATAQTAPTTGDQIAFDRPEAWAMKYFTSATALSGPTTPVRPTPGPFSRQFESGSHPRFGPPPGHRRVNGRAQRAAHP